MAFTKFFFEIAERRTSFQLEATKDDDLKKFYRLSWISIQLNHSLLHIYISEKGQHKNYFSSFLSIRDYEPGFVVLKLMIVRIKELNVEEKKKMLENKRKKEAGCVVVENMLTSIFTISQE